MSAESESFPLFICLEATKSAFLSVLALKETIRPKMWSKSRPKIAKKIPLPVDVRRSKTFLLIKLPAAVYKDNKLGIPKWSKCQLTHTERDLSRLPIAQQEYC